jgi:hypothetical protein
MIAILAVAARAGSDVEGLDDIADAAAFAFGRLMRDASGPLRRR